MKLGNREIKIETDSKWKLSVGGNQFPTWTASVENYDIRVEVEWRDNLMHKGLEYVMTVSRMAPVESGGKTEDYKNHEIVDSVEALQFKLDEWVSKSPERAVVHIHMLRDSI